MDDLSFSEYDLKILQDLLVSKNVNFLLGAGASAPYFSPLNNMESLITDIENSYLETSKKESMKNLLILFFLVLSVCDNYSLISGKEDEKSATLMSSIIEQYTSLINIISNYMFLRNSKINPIRINVFTTNYDLFLEKAFDLYLEKNNRISLNDGSEGYFRKYIDSDNYNKTTAHSGMYDNYYMETPTFNLIKLHGSANWELDDNNKILINNDLGYFENFKKIAHKILNANFIDYNEEEQSNYINNLICDIENCLNLEILEDEENLFSSIEIDKIHLDKMNKLQIIIPTKEKLKNTVFSNHYYSMIRYMKETLEKKDSVLVIFGFSFADEHLRTELRRAFTNPGLLIYIVCYRDSDKDKILNTLDYTDRTLPINITFITPSAIKSFTNYNKTLEYAALYGEEIKRNYSDIIEFLSQKESSENYLEKDIRSLRKFLEELVSIEEIIEDPEIVKDILMNPIVQHLYTTQQGGIEFFYSPIINFKVFNNILKYRR
ncbi:hypothetical protein JZB01_002763 [Listeria monocytogenes]|nr:hypothetical protein [Listeria monocytogenes]EHD0417799.1 hypothetical protein [Listeria monocytogenes]